MESLVLIQESRLKELIKEVLTEHEINKKRGEPEPVYTINQISKRLRMAHSTLKKKVEAGLIKTTVDGLITESSVNDYLQNKPP